MFGRSQHVPRTIVSPIPFDVVFAKWNEVASLTSLTKERSFKKQRSRDDYAGALVHAYAAPTTAAEKEMAQMWSAVLGIAPIGRDDDFFALGGHSLAALRLNTQIDAGFQVKMHVMDIYEHATLKALCKHIENLQQRQDTRDLADDGALR